MRKDILVYAAMVLSWGGNWAAIKIALGYVSPLLLAGLRTSMGGAALCLLYYRPSRMPLDFHVLKTLMVSTLFNVVLWNVLIHLGLQKVASGIGSVLAYTYPAMVLLLSRFILKEKVSPIRWLGVVTSIAGIVFIVNGEAIFNLSIGFGELLVLLSSLSWAIGTVYYKRSVSAGDMLAFNSLQILLGGVIVLLASFFLERPVIELTTNSILAIAYSGFIAAGLGFIAWFYLLDRYNASTLSANLFLVPLIALIIGTSLLGEHLTIYSLIGSVLVIVGVYLANRT